MEPVLHKLSKQHINDFIGEPAHAVLILGPVGSGTGTVASYITSVLLSKDQEKLAYYPYFTHIHPDKSISIEIIRNLQEFTRLKTPGTETIRRVIILENANTMTIEAQNAFLKLLEEPPADTIIIMTSESLQGLLPTVVSRTQRIQLHAPATDQLTRFFSDQGHKQAEIKKMLYISDGQIGLMSALLNSEEDHPLINGIDVAKQWLGQTLYERLRNIDHFTKQKELLSDTLDGLQRICMAGFRQALETEKSSDALRWQKTLKKVLAAKEAFERNAQPKLLLTNLLLNI
jgi:DNA polymerase-3 subunit delta'